MSPYVTRANNLLFFSLVNCIVLPALTVVFCSYVCYSCDAVFLLWGAASQGIYLLFKSDPHPSPPACCTCVCQKIDPTDRPLTFDLMPHGVDICDFWSWIAPSDPLTSSSSSGQNRILSSTYYDCKNNSKTKNNIIIQYQQVNIPMLACSSMQCLASQSC